MTDKAWKAWERYVCSLFGGKRRGADYQESNVGKNDCHAEGFSVECKLLARPTYQQMFDACIQAELAKENLLDISVAVVKKKGELKGNALVIMRLDEFRAHFLTD